MYARAASPLTRPLFRGSSEESTCSACTRVAGVISQSGLGGCEEPRDGCRGGGAPEKGDDVNGRVVFDGDILEG